MAQVGANNEPLHERALFGYDGADWQKLALIFGYSDRLGELVENVSLSAGNNNLYGSYVPSGQVWIVTSIAAYIIGTSPGYFHLAHTGTGSSLVLMSQPSPVTRQTYSIPGNVVMKAGDRFALFISGATAGDTARFSYNGYIMEVA